MSIKNKVQLITYPDSLGKDLSELNKMLHTAFIDLFQGGVHILPPFPSSGDRGFAPINYFEIEKEFGTWADMNQIAQSHDVLIDLMVNHISRQSEYFLDYAEHGHESRFKDLFITLDKIWEDGIPVQKDIDKMFLRRRLPYSEYTVNAGKDKVKLWTTFGKTDPSEQIDLDINSALTKELLQRTLKHFCDNGIKIVRLDAIGYVIKKLGTSCFFVEPEIYEFLSWICDIAKQYNLELLPEVHSHYSIQYKLAEKGYWIYDFILPYRIIEALILKDFTHLGEYLKQRPSKQFTLIDCHDGIPVIPDMNDLIDIDNAKKVVDVCMERGSNLSHVFSDEHKQKDGFDVHQIRGTLYSILNENDDDYIISRAIQFFTPGIPQVYYVGLLAGTNQYACAEKTGDGREIHRYNYSIEEIEANLGRKVVQRLMKLIDLRNNHKSFGGHFSVDSADTNELKLRWINPPHTSCLYVNFETKEAYIDHSCNSGVQRYCI